MSASLPAMDRVKEALTSAREGLGRTLRWMTGRLRPDERSESPEPSETSPAPAAAPAAASASDDATWGEKLADRLGYSQRTIGLAAGIGVIVLLWLGWTAYVWAENGMTAGLGVLISWPAVFAILGLIAAPFVGGAVAVRRHRAGMPILAEFAGTATADTATDEKPWQPKAEADSVSEESEDEEETSEDEESEDEESAEGDESDDDDGDSDASDDSDDSTSDESGDSS